MTELRGGKVSVWESYFGVRVGGSNPTLFSFELQSLGP